MAKLASSVAGPSTAIRAALALRALTPADCERLLGWIETADAL